jgi:hypothetical protein
MHLSKKRTHGICVYIGYHRGSGFGLFRVSAESQERARWFAGWICLVAIAFMYAPLAGAMLLAQGTDCCAGGYCKVPAHHHGKTSPSAEQTAKNAVSEPSCEHEHTGMTQCTMSCCRDAARPALMPVAFVLPAVSLAPEPGETLRAVPAIAATEILRFERPLSPPPRTPASLL